MRRRYMISWRCNDTTGRDIWVMERRGNINSADIKKLERTLADKWGLKVPVTLTHIYPIN
jgi:hypothetical protein